MDRLRDVDGLVIMVGDSIGEKGRKVLLIKNYKILTTMIMSSQTIWWDQEEINKEKWKIINPERLRAKDKNGDLISVGDEVNVWGEVLGIIKALDNKKYDFLLLKDSETNSGLNIKYAKDCTLVKPAKKIIELKMLENLEMTLCDPDGNVCVKGSKKDREIIQEVVNWLRDKYRED